MSLREEMWKYEQITGESAEHVPIMKLGAFLDGYEMAIKALGQQPRDNNWKFYYDHGYEQAKRDLLCEDCVSRKAVDELSEELVHTTRDKADFLCNFWEGLQKLPSVTPKYTDEEIDKAQAVEQAYVDKMVELAVKETERPKGKWIQTKDDCDGVNFYDFSFKCSKCGKEQSFKSNYCPNCGADMRGEAE